ncbi:MAG: HAD family hydrolase [Actinomycetales bacterium]
MDWTNYKAALFDLDGVVTPTAQVHMIAWNEMFSEFLASRGIPEPYTDSDYFAYVDGKPRYDGVRAMLASRGIEIPDGEPDDPASAETVCGLGNRKNAVFTQVLERDGVQAYPGSVALIEHLLATGTRIAVVSSSQNAPSVLRAAGLLDKFELVVDGKLAKQNSLPGKPAPDTFAYAAAELDATNAEAVVLEDAVSGVQAGRAGDFGLVIGVDRGAGADELTQAGADVVVTDLAELIA